MDIAIKPKVADQIRTMAERFPDDEPAALAKRGNLTLHQVKGATEARRPNMPKSRFGSLRVA